jgi:hypothetical protein
VNYLTDEQRSWARWIDAHKCELILQAAIKPRWGLLITGVLGFCVPLMAAVLPEDRADVLYHSYSGGGLDVNGPSVLARKQFGKYTSIWGNYYVDTITSATIDVVTSASQYNEERTEKSLGIDYLQDKAIISLAYTNSVENDFEANAVNFGVSQSMFGDLTTVSLGYARGWDTITATGSPDFEEQADRQKYRLSVSQVLSKNLLMELNFETVTDEGFLNNPYRSVSYIDPADPGCVTTRCSESELYPNTRTSHAVALRALYYLPYRATIKGGARVFTDTWGINASIFELGYTHPWSDHWTFDIHYRYYRQTQADFYQDLFQREAEFTYRARDKELSTFSDYTIGLGANYEFAKHGWGFIDKGSVNFNYDYIQFDYKNFRDLRAQGIAPGNEPLYSFSTKVLRFFVSIWY